MSLLLGIVFAGLAAITWGINSHILHRGAQNEHPMMALIYRTVVSFPILLVVTLVFRGKGSLLVYLDSFNSAISMLLVLSIIIGDAIFIYSMKRYPVSVILPIATSYPLLTTIILILFGLEIVTLPIILGTLGVVFGIFLVTRYRYNSENIRTGIGIEAVMLGIGVAFGWGISVIFARIILDQDGTESFGLMTIRTLFIGIVACIVYFQSKENRINYQTKPRREKIRSLKIFGLSGIFGWVLGATFLFLALENTKTSIATPISAANPVIAVIIGQFTGIDRINLKQFTGIIIVTIGVVLIVL